MHVRYNNLYKTGADRGNILGQPILFECVGFCLLSPAYESEMRGYIVSLLIVNISLVDFIQVQPQYIRLDGLIVDLGGDYYYYFFF